MENEVLYGEYTKLSARNMTFSDFRLKDFPEYIEAGLGIKAACAIANHRSGYLSDKKKDAIVSACKELRMGKYKDQFIVDVYHGGCEAGINMNFNEVIASRAGEGIDPVDDVNMNQSAQDFCRTVTRVAVIISSKALLKVLDNIYETAENKVEQFSGYEAAVLLEGFKEVFGYEETILEQSLEELKWTGIGDGAGDDFKTSLEEVLKGSVDPSFEVIHEPYAHLQYPSDLVRLSSQIRITSGVLSKIAGDIRTLISGPDTDGHVWTIPDLQKGFPYNADKTPAVLPETVIQCDLMVGGNDSVIQNAFTIEGTQTNTREAMMGFLLLQNIRMLRRAARSFNRHCFAGLGPSKAATDRNDNERDSHVVKYRKRDRLKRVVSTLKNIKKKGR